MGFMGYSLEVWAVVLSVVVLGLWISYIEAREKRTPKE